MSMLTPAFSDPVISAQVAFRGIMDALARPGTVVPLTENLAPPPPLSRGAATVALALCDRDTPIWLDDGLAARDAVGSWLRFHSGAPIVTEPQMAAFAILADAERAPPFDRFPLGTAEFPDRSATLILQVGRLGDGRSLTLTGPGIRGRRQLRATSLPADLPRRLAANRALFPRGIDLMLVTDSAIAALPRSVTLIEEV